LLYEYIFYFFFSSRRRHTRSKRDWSSDVCSSDLIRNIKRGKVFDENFLMSVATLGAFGIGEFPEAVAVMLFYQIGELFQSYAVRSEERRVGQECRRRGTRCRLKRKRRKR